MKIDFAAHSKKEPVRQVKKSSTSLWKKDIRLLNTFSDKRKEAFYREFSMLLRSGVDFGQALSLLIAQEKYTYIKQTLEAIKGDIVVGKSLYGAFNAQKDFTAYEVFSIRAGEEIRRLPEVLSELQRYFKRKIKVRRQVISVLAYPCFVLAITFGVLYFMLNYVVPMFSTIFEQFGGELPKITQYVVFLSSKFNSFLLIVLGIFLVLFLIHRNYKSNTRYRSITTAIVLKIPVFGALIKKIAIAKFFQIMGLLLSSRTPLNEALQLAADVTSFYPLRKLVDASIGEIAKGNTLHNALDKGFFEPKLMTVISIGEEVNQLDAMFNNVTDQLNEEIDHSTKLIGTIIEPLMIVIIAVVVGFILIAMYYPMTNISEVLTN